MDDRKPMDLEQGTGRISFLERLDQRPGSRRVGDSSEHNCRYRVYIPACNQGQRGGDLPLCFRGLAELRFAQRRSSWLEGMSEALAQERKPFGIKVLIVEAGAFRTEFVGTALKHMPAMEAYKDTVGGTRAFALGMHNTQGGGPRKGAQAIYAAINDPNTPIRLQLGADAVGAVRADAQALLAEMAKWEAVALNTKI